VEDISRNTLSGKEKAIRLVESETPSDRHRRATISLSGTGAGRIAWKNRQHDIGGIENTTCTSIHSFTRAMQLSSALSESSLYAGMAII
jgi:hypothetical protein